ncbi:GntR family transcriptional regulator [Actibacterium sp. 188UL27-1]|uniref:GntR family transcriptional regulator n=1 Tax=Actibacterium sp. 188UL27-1 TaxID=2786961 RepID=UPI001EF5A505|nr:GntR family transcriptional regulator [Actibacterium sp. 188UL27-1]
MHKPSKSGELYSRMRADILSLKLPPGGALRLPALSERYDLGITPIRDCLNRLSADKLVVIEHNKGFRVAGLSLMELLDLERSRCIIEGALFARAMEQGDDSWEAGLIGAYHHLTAISPMSVLGSEDELTLWNRRHDAFHDALIARVDAPWMLHFHRQLRDQLVRYQRFIQTGLRDLHQTHPDAAPQAAEIYATALATEPHDALYQVAIGRDVSAAKTVVEAHVNLSIKAFERLSTLIPANTQVAKILQAPNAEIQI